MKKFIILTCIFTCACLCLVGCKSKDDKTSYNKKDLQQVQKEVILALTQNQQPTFDTNEYPVTEKVVKNFEKNLKVIKKECGQIDDITTKTKYEYVSGDINVTTNLKCTKRDATVTAIFEYDAENDNKITLTSLTFDPVYTTAEKLKQAGANTIIGMGTVFAVLIFIFLVISCFNLIPKVQKLLRREKARAAAPSVEKARKKHKAMKTEEDSELVAVISAAIAASENQSTDSFVVRSIRRR